MPVVIHGGGTIEGIATGGLPDGCVDTDTLGALAVTSGKIAAAVPLGISVADQWRITSNLTGSTSYTPTNWEQVDTDGFAVLGSSMSHSSGVFTFPSTGIYQITFYTWFYIDNAYDNE